MRRVLVVDDDAAIRQVMAEVLRDEGYVVMEASDGEIALEFARHDPPDMILMDLRMPKLDGVSAIRALKSDPTTALIPIIAMSAGNVLRAEAEQLPVAAVISKPFELDALLESIAINL